MQNGVMARKFKQMPWTGKDWTNYCSHCGLMKETKFPPGDAMQLCAECYKTIEIRAQAEPLPIYELDLPTRRRITSN